MDDLFREFWWLSFPLSFMLLGAFRAWLEHRARRDLMQTLRQLASEGRDPPAALLAELRR
ncbi:hypothetical protein B7G68_11965 [Caulobacter segnis]|jgi:hypothetical protein|uniref:Uncharacterized protein n=2 Tax=Caulobacter segnis TaxID=88688 RepID=D5VH74_CAUST|nr:hypothetical protein [Caulobacter segnis]ADG10792.1 conserved hypothetical protein [Caulobacter segnis ATCC 21756]AVQ02497.1 hypothetical protein B7G68_11965 [Caulobacter segnis]